MTRVAGFFAPLLGARKAWTPVFVPTVTAPAMIPLPPNVPAFTLTAPVPVPDPFRLLTNRIPLEMVVPPV